MPSNALAGYELLGGAESRWSTIIQDETYSFPTPAERSSNAKAMEAERTIKDKKKKRTDKRKARE